MISSPDVPRPWPASTVTTPRGRLTVRRADAERPGAERAVLVHGLGGSSLNWTELMGLLRPRLVSEALDLPGFGESPPPDDGDYSPQGHARAVEALIEERRDGPVHLLGNSLGGLVALLVAARRPELVRSLTLVSPALPDLRLRWPSAQLPFVALPVVGERVTMALARQTPERRVEGILRLCHADPASVPASWRAEAAREVVRRAALPYARDAMLASLRALLSAYVRRGVDAPWAIAATVRTPTLLVQGADDRLVPTRVAVRAARTLPDARLLILSRCGHIAQVEHPELVAGAVLDHVADVAGRGAAAS